MKYVVRPLILLCFFINLSCTNEGNAPSGGATVVMPLVTAPVSGASASAFGPRATTGASLKSGSCSSCGSGMMSNLYSLASAFAVYGAMADLNSCTTSAVAKAGIIPGLTSGEYKYLDMQDSKMKVKVTVSGTVMSSYELFYCDADGQNQYVSGTNDGTNVTFTMKIKPAGTNYFVNIGVEGTLSGTTWTSKRVTTGFYNGASGSTTYSYFTMTQGLDYLDVSGIYDQGTLGTVDGTDWRMVSRAQLLGNSYKTYALGDGSSKHVMGTGSVATTNWNGDTGVHGSGPTTYDSVVSSATVPSLPTSRVTTFSSDETWDCSMESPVDTSSAMSNSAFMTDMMACASELSQ